MATILAINGTAVDLDATRSVLNRLTLSVDQPSCFEWGQWGVALPIQYDVGDAVTVTVDGTLVFKGQVVSTHLSPIGEGPIDVGYRALDLKYLASLIPVTNPQAGTGTCRFNLPSTDPNFDQQLSGMSVGQILQYLFDGHSTALASIGVTGYNAADLAALTIVPPTQTGVLIQGSDFIDQCEMFLQAWYAQYVLFIPANGTIRVMDSTAFTPTTFTLDQDPIVVSDLSRDSSRCFTRVEIRGWAEVEPAYLSLSQGTLQEAFTSEDKLTWNWYDFTNPSGGTDSGTITLLTSTQVTVQSSNASETWTTNYWPGIQASIQLINPINTGIEFTESRQVTACTAMSPGGTAVITFAQPLVNSGYTEYYLWGQPPNLSNCWRLYNIVPTWVAEHLMNQFPYSVPWSPVANEVVMTSFPEALICWSPNGEKPYIEFPFTFELLPATGQIRFTQPVVRIFGTLSNLEKGGSATDGIPDDILVLLPYSRGPLNIACPANGSSGQPQYQGTAYTDDGIERTLYLDYPQWMWAGDAPAYSQLACQVLLTVCNTVVSGEVTYYGKYSPALTLGLAANISSVDGTTGYESVNAAIRTVVLEWPQSGPTPWATHLSCSSVRRPFSGDTLYAHPMFAQGRAFGMDGFEGINMMDPSSVASSLAGSMSWMGGNNGAEMAAGLMGNSNELRKGLGLDELPQAEGVGGERGETDDAGGMGGMGGMDFGGGSWGGDDTPRPNKPRRKRPTLKPKPKRDWQTESSADEPDPYRMGSAPAEAAGSARVPISDQARRRKRAQDNQARDALGDRHDPDEQTPAKPAPTPPPAPAPRAQEQRQQRARRSQDLGDRYDD